jgi:sterol desaturase/sphingolipid hydroxylase (fatty acid hydroxylase superfamily)
MTQQSAVRQDPPIRLFKSDFLEFFSHISPLAVAAIWAPVSVFFLGRAVLAWQPGTSWLHIPAGIFLGWFVWTFVEYTLHRFLFHYHPRTERLKRMFFMMHGVHHAQPMCRTRLVMPPALSVPMSSVFFVGGYALIVVGLGAPHWFDPVMVGLVAGYLIYDLTHYQIHHANVTSGWFFKLRKHHLRHHGACDFMRFGVSTTIWDHVFGTMPKAPCQELINRGSGKPADWEPPAPA